jgi:hypothetical protein
MSNPNWPGGYPEYPAGQPQDPNTTPAGQQPYPAPYQTPGSQPLNPYGTPLDPGQTANPYLPPGTNPPYGQPAGPSQPMYPYGQPAAPSQPMWQQGPFGQPSAPPAAPKRSRTWLWITLAVVVVLLAGLGGGAVFAIQQLQAPANVAVQFCNDLKTQDYASAYGLLGSSLQGQYTGDQFKQGSQILDTVEGPVTACKQASGSNAYSYSLGASSATLSAVITRAKQGDLTGTLHLASQNGTWKVSAVDTSLLGVNLGALATAGTFCQALQAKDYSTAYGLLGSTAQSQISQADFQASTVIWDQLDGPVTGCTLTGLGAGNSDTAAALTVSLTRQTRGAQSGSLGMDVEGGAWKISQVDSTLFGTDLDPLIVGTAFCDAIVATKFDVAYALLTSDLQGQYSKAQFADIFRLPAGIKYVSCAPKLSTYKVNGSDANLDMTVKINNGGTNENHTFKLALTKEGTDWKIAGAELS